MSLTTKYRPVFIEDLLGQPQAQRLISSWISADRIPSAILLQGDTSAGKTTTARIIGRTVLCHSRKDGNACGECKSCIAFGKNHPDYLEVDAATDRGIDAMRDLTKKITMMPLMGKRRVVLLDECHQISGPGWQAWLKTLEEPPAHATVIAATTNPEKLPAAVRGRLSVVKLRPVPTEDLVALLSKVAKAEGLGKAGIEEAHLTKIAKVTRHPRNALHALDQVLSMALAAQKAGQALDTALINGYIDDAAQTDVETTALAIVRGVLDGKPGGAMKRVDDNRADADVLLTKVLTIMRQALLLATSPKLLDPYYQDGFNGLRIFSLPEAKFPVCDALEVFQRLRIDTANHSVPVDEVLDASVCRAGLVIQSFIRKADKAVGDAPGPNKPDAREERTNKPVDGAPKRSKNAIDVTMP